MNPEKWKEMGMHEHWCSKLPPRRRGQRRKEKEREIRGRHWYKREGGVKTWYAQPKRPATQADQWAL
jgi:hypothetical protein